MTGEQRTRAGKHQLKYFLANQYPMWRVAMVKSIKKILENPQAFYGPMFDEIKSYDDEDADATINCEIRNGLFFEALSQSVQAVEDLFSLMRNSDDVAFFAKNVITYQASQVTRYIRAFDTSNTEYMLRQYGEPYFDFETPWENTEVFENYKVAVNLIREYLDALIAHHKKYYFHYCQYKHGLSVALRPYGNQYQSGNAPLEGAVMAFDNVQYQKRHSIPSSALMIPDFHPNIASHVSELHQENNLLRADQRIVNLQDFIDITEKSYALLSVLHRNLNYFCDVPDDAEVHEFAFPTRDYKKSLIIGFPTA